MSINFDNLNFKSITRNILIGIFLVILMQYNKDLSLVKAQQEIGMDFMMQISAGTSVPDGITPYVMLDIDSKTYRSWDEPVLTPHDKLIKLINYSVKGGAVITIVDIDVSVTSERDSTELSKYFVSLAEYLSTSKSQHVFLMKTFKERIDGESPQYRLQRSSELDEIVSSSDYIHWTSPLFELDTDMTVRRWRLVEKTCFNNTPVIIPSAQLLAYALKNETDTGVIYKKLSGFLPDNCKEWQGLVSDSIKFGDATVNLNSDKVLKRIIYEMPWSYQGDYAYPYTSVVQNGNEVSVPLFTALSAGIIANSTSSVDASIVNNRNVIIGASYPGSRDVYSTPLGLMPGSVIVLNSLHSLISYGDIKPVSTWMILLVNIILISIITCLYSFISPIAASLVSGLLTAIVILPAGMLLFKDGIWLDFAVPLIVVQIVEVLARAEMLWLKYKDKQDDNV
ncbi:MAG: hypothetical protein DIZ80_08145 [endosymbiont of Galathealinum brachiosum]|uniref:CHASE2 domain-containing protein n=1 Tax=endosymbiont of Galathealinum brachiosum TaxID=2200906 RepID=A0A370DGX8_9GAMM|nr:MAG: hypothetical protein DIZ80_08145 [endosymbiont of Galathealinum brachiosum]